MTDSKYFTTTKKGEIFELKSELMSDKKEKKKEAVKKVNWFNSIRAVVLECFLFFFVTKSATFFPYNTV